MSVGARGCSDPVRAEEGGSASVVLLGVAAIAVLALGTVLPTMAALSLRSQVAAAADAAALASADTASGRVPGSPCERAEAVARANGAAVEACDIAGPEASITASVRWGPFDVRVRSRAGPPSSAREDGRAGTP